MKLINPSLLLLLLLLLSGDIETNPGKLLSLVPAAWAYEQPEKPGGEEGKGRMFMQGLLKGEVSLYR
jgi:hypothetical protein